MQKYFFLDESPIFVNKYVIRMDIDNECFPRGIRGSYDVLIARVMNMKYTDYLRYCRDELGAELIGKGRRYITPYFDKNQLTKLFIKVLNERMTYIMSERKSPFIYKEEDDGTITRVPIEIDENNT